MRDRILKTIKWFKERFLMISIVVVIYFWGILASFGLIFGYLTSRYCSGPTEKVKGIVPSMKLSLGRYRLHLHHWLLSVSCLIPLKIYGVFDWSSFLFWFGGGVALQGVLCYGDWYKIISRKER